MLVDQLIQFAMSRAANKLVQDLRVGINYTAAMLDDGSCGLAYSFHQELGYFQGILDKAGSFTGRPARQLIPLAASTDLLKSVVGVAVLNAVVNSRAVLESNTGLRQGKGLEWLGLTPQDTVGMVGHFGPLVPRVKQQVKELFILERRTMEDEWVFPDWAAPQILPQCDVIILTGTTVINKTIDMLLPYCTGARQIAVLGPSTPLVPPIFWPVGVTVLAGMEVLDGPAVLKVIGEGGGARNCNKYMQALGFSKY